MFPYLWDCSTCGHSNKLEIPIACIDYTPAEKAVMYPNEKATPGSPAEARVSCIPRDMCAECGTVQTLDKKDIERGAAAWIALHMQDQADAHAEAAEERRRERMANDDHLDRMILREC